MRLQGRTESFLYFKAEGGNLRYFNLSHLADYILQALQELPGMGAIIHNSNAWARVVSFGSTSLFIFLSIA